MITTDDLYNLFNKCFPGIIRSEESAKALLSAPDNRVLTTERDGTVVSAAVINENHIVMLCVLPEYRGQGIGSALLAECESHIRDAGYDTVSFMRCKHGYLTPGVPMEFPGYDGNRVFFEKRGYVHTWGDGECVDMMLDMTDIDDLGVNIGDTVPAVSKKHPELDPDALENRMTYRFADESDMEKTADCVAEALEHFVQYYKNPEPYRGEDGERVLIAENGNGLVCGALLVSAGGEAAGLGSVGCTSTRESYQGRGIAPNMVKAGTMYLKQQGLEKGYLGFTYTDIIPMYARAGYKVSMKYFMGEKKL